MWELRPEMGIGAGALSHAVYEQSIVPVRERELARMRIAQINGCAICQQWRSTPGAERRVTEDDYAHVLEWRTYRRLLRAGAARDRVRGTVRARPPQHRRRVLRRGCARAYTDAEILDLTVCIGGWIALGRTLHVLGLDATAGSQQ